ncbi:MAG TPA: alcohol dehydrogenase catalytic domain-containing protein [Streptosporangiaceae bacterium]|nr:alcohol dehydrogenase catalytic domain-containing protein [Streptosporangiaceae bacterium]
MLAAVTQSPGVMVVDNVSEPGPPGPADVIIRPEAVGICGSDLHVYSGDVGALSGARDFFPRIQGHEFSAVIEAAGKDCPGGVKAGDRVAVWPLHGCGRCYPCRVGRANACVSLELFGIHRDGGLQQLLSVPASHVFGVGDLDAESSAFIEPMSIAVHAVDRAEIRAGQQVVILGAGPIGLATTMAAVAAGARVMATDPVAARRDLAVTVGAEHVAWGSDGELLDAAGAWTRRKGPPRVIDTTGDPAVLAQATAMVCSAGRVVVVGMSAATAPLRTGIFPEKEIDVVGSSCASAADFRAAVRLVQAHREPIAALFSHRFPLTQARAAIECVASSPAEIVKVLITLGSV